MMAPANFCYVDQYCGVLLVCGKERGYEPLKYRGSCWSGIHLYKPAKRFTSTFSTVVSSRRSGCHTGMQEEFDSSIQRSLHQRAQLLKKVGHRSPLW